MSDTPSTSAESSAKAEPRTRRISNPRPKKSAKSAKPEPAAESAAEPAAKFPEFPSSAESAANAATPHEWPDPEPPTSGAASTSENPKRKRRRKKGKGGAQSQASADHESSESTTEPGSNASQQTRQNQPPRVKVDAEQLAKFAWKIYLAEVSEEGVALVGDNDARELSRRCFRLAEIFLEEQARRR